MNLDSIAEKIRVCKSCDLWKTRTNAVPGEGPSNAKIMFVGLAPGSEEDLKGKPFVGRAGKMLDMLLNSIKLRRESVFITSVLKCHPPRNRIPKKKEIDACKTFLEQQIEAIKPKIIVLLGGVASETLLNEKKISELHGKSITKDGVIYFPTFHPAAGLRFPKIKEKLERDFKRLKRLIS
jgi:DNA polymerase